MNWCIFDDHKVITVVVGMAGGENAFSLVSGISGINSVSWNFCFILYGTIGEPLFQQKIPYKPLSTDARAQLSSALHVQPKYRNVARTIHITEK
ncbi:hypothetical protein ACE6H2_026205 [Prunus campanulata]